MRTQISRFKKPGAYLVIMAALVTSLFGSCSEDDDIILQNLASVTIVNAADGSAAQDFYLDDAKVNSQALAYTQSSGYITVAPGTRKAEFKSSGSATVSSTANVNLQAGKSYTIFYTGGTSSSASYTTEDDLTLPSTGKAKVRFVHLSSAIASNVDLAVQGGTKIVSNLAYKTASAYSEIDPAVSLQLSAAGSATVISNLTALNLQANKVYTIYISGSTTLNVSAKVITNR